MAQLLKASSLVRISADKFLGGELNSLCEVGSNSFVSSVKLEISSRAFAASIASVRVAVILPAGPAQLVVNVFKVPAPHD